MSKNSISPTNRLRFVPPRVNAPPGSSSVADESLRNRESQNAISGELSWFPWDRDCQNGVECVLAMVWKASPMIPETVPSRSPSDS